jgi:hypothetical protein
MEFGRLRAEQPLGSVGERPTPTSSSRGSTPEFDYPKGTDNVYATYAGAGGVAVGGIARRALFAWYFKDPNRKPSCNACLDHGRAPACSYP